VIGLALAGGPACKKKAPPEAESDKAPAAAQKGPAGPSLECPPPTTFAPLSTEKGRKLETACVVFASGLYWLATALEYDEKTGANPALYFMSGNASGRVMVYDLKPAPTEAIQKLIQDSKRVSMQIRRTHNDNALVRLGVMGHMGEGENADRVEVGMLLKLVAHAPPQVLWVGEGDRRVTGPDGCVEEQVIDFELLFRTRLEKFATARAYPAPGNKTATCRPGPSMQDSVAFKPVSLERPRPLVPEGEAGKKPL